MKLKKSFAILLIGISTYSVNLSRVWAETSQFTSENTSSLDYSQLAYEELVELLSARQNQVAALKRHLENAQVVVYQNDSKRYFIQNIGMFGTIAAGFGGLGYLAFTATENQMFSYGYSLRNNIGTMISALAVSIALAAPVFAMLAPANAQIIELTESEYNDIKAIVDRLNNDIELVSNAIRNAATSNVQFTQ